VLLSLMEDSREEVSESVDTTEELACQEAGMIESHPSESDAEVEEEAESQEEELSEAEESVSGNTVTSVDGRKFSEPETTTTEDSQTTRSAHSL